MANERIAGIVSNMRRWLDQSADAPFQQFALDREAIRQIVEALASEPTPASFPNRLEPKVECPHCREVYEIWANTEGFTPKTAPESYQQRVIEQMREAAAKGLG